MTMLFGVLIAVEGAQTSFVLEPRPFINRGNNQTQVPCEEHELQGMFGYVNV